MNHKVSDKGKFYLGTEPIYFRSIQLGKLTTKDEVRPQNK